MIMNFSGITARRHIAGVAAGSTTRGVAAATIAAPNAAAAPDCTADGVSNTVSATLGSARAYLNTHPGANQAVGAAFSQPRSIRRRARCAATSPPIRRSTTT